MDKQSRSMKIRELQGRLLGTMAISDQSRQYIDKEISRTAMSGMLNLGNVLELIDDAFDHSPSAQQDFVKHVHQAVLHIPPQLGNQDQVVVTQQLLK